MALTREQFEGLRPVVEKVPIPGTEDVVHVSTILACTRELFDNMVSAVDEDEVIPDLPARLACLCLCGPDGTLWYPEASENTEAMAETAQRLAKTLGAPVIHEVFLAARKLNRMGKDAVEEAAKNSEKTPDDSSSTG
jgi:hypothetical protein